MKGGEAVSKQKPWNWMLFPFSAVKMDGDNVYAASPGNGIYHSSSTSDWTRISEDLPSDLVVNRLQLAQGKLYACTNEGLFTYEDGEWRYPVSSIPCYQYKSAGQCSWAATEYGLWHRCGGAWEKVACPELKVYDFLNLPQFLIVGHENGMAVYDRLVDEWSEYDLQVEVTSLAVYHGHLLGAGAGGELIVGNKRGGFDVLRFDNRIIFSLVRQGGHVYACTDKGLYRIGYLRGQVTLFAVKLGFPVTDVDSDGKEMMMATLFEGIQTMPLGREQEEEA